MKPSDIKEHLGKRRLPIYFLLDATQHVSEQAFVNALSSMEMVFSSIRGQSTEHTTPDISLTIAQDKISRLFRMSPITQFTFPSIERKGHIQLVDLLQASGKHIAEDIANQKRILKPFVFLFTTHLRASELEYPISDVIKHATVITVLCDKNGKALDTWKNLGLVAQHADLTEDNVRSFFAWTSSSVLSPSENTAEAIDFSFGFDDTEQLQQVFFTGCYPHNMYPNRRYALIVYSHIEEELETVQGDVKKFLDDFGDEHPVVRTAKQHARLKNDTPITIVPESDDIEFSPERLTKKWDGHWNRYIFEFKANESLINEVLFIRISIQISGFEVAHIKCTVDVLPSPSKISETSIDNPLAKAKVASKSTKMYDRIFVSYSRKDTEIARAYRLAQIAAGNDVFLDTESIRSGEDWKAALANAIDRADIFQLFWSPNSADSPAVRSEWDYALKYRCPNDECREFIRPVFWKKPMPSPPPELEHLNFRYVPFTDDQEDIW